MAKFQSADAYNAAGDQYRDQVVSALREAGRPAPDPKWARSAGGFLAENGGDVDEALTSATYAGLYDTMDVLARYAAALRELAAVSVLRSARAA